MTTALKELFDDAASDAVAGLRIDVGEVVARSRRRRVRLRSVGSVLLAAAAAAAVALALPLVLSPPTMPATRQDRVGLPDRWYFTPSFAPPVTRAHMTAASMMLAGEGGDPVLVSADASTYARLPWGPDDAMAALSSDGTRIAWSRQGADRSTIHILRLSDGHEVEGALPAGSGRVSQLVWAGGQVFAVTGGLVARIDGGSGAVSRLCTCSPGGLGTDRAGVLVQATGGGIPDLADVPSLSPIDVFPAPGAPGWSRSAASAASPAWGYVSSPLFAVAPDGRRSAAVEWANAKDGWELVVSTETRKLSAFRLTTPAGQIVDVEILAWSDAGILVRQDRLTDAGRGSVLMLLDPDSGTGRVVSSRYESVAGVPMAVAPGLVGDGSPITAAAPHYPTWDRGRVFYAAQQLWRSNYPYWQLMVLAGLVSVAGLTVIHRRRRVPR